MIFLDIGNYSINLDHVVNIHRSSTREVVTLKLDVLDGDSPSIVNLYHDDAIAFKEWWARRRPAGLTIFQL